MLGKAKLLWGVVLISAAFVCIVATFYFIGQADQADKKKIALLDDQLAKLKEQAKNLSHADKTHEPMKLGELVKKAEDVYDSAEKNRKEGSLWLDRRSNSFIVTLGALQGLLPGSQLSIYDGSKKMDTASVEIPFDVISYVKPVKSSPDSFTGNYYRVVIEDHPTQY